MFVIMMIISMMDNMMTVLTIMTMNIRVTIVVFLVFMVLLDRMTMNCIMISVALMAVGDIVSLGALSELSALMCHTGAKIGNMMY